MGISKPLTVS